MTPSIYKMLRIISENPSQKPKVLAGLYGCNPMSASITLTLKGLRGSGWVNQHHGHLYDVTEKGRTVLEHVAILEALE